MTSQLSVDLPELARLTRRELEVMRLASVGHRSQDIADILVVSKRTVDFHLAGVFHKLGVRNRIQAIRATHRLGLFPFEPTSNEIVHAGEDRKVAAVCGFVDMKTRAG